MDMMFLCGSSTESVHRSAAEQMEIEIDIGDRRRNGMAASLEAFLGGKIGVDVGLWRCAWIVSMVGGAVLLIVTLSECPIIYYLCSLRRGRH